jgi:hypothetical protein
MYCLKMKTVFSSRNIIFCLQDHTVLHRQENILMFYNKTTTKRKSNNKRKHKLIPVVTGSTDALHSNSCDAVMIP